MVALEEMEKWQLRHPTIRCRFYCCCSDKGSGYPMALDELIEHGVAQPEEIGRIGGGSIKGWKEGIKHMSISLLFNRYKEVKENY